MLCRKHPLDDLTSDCPPFPPKTNGIPISKTSVRPRSAELSAIGFRVIDSIRQPLAVSCPRSKTSWHPWRRLPSAIETSSSQGALLDLLYPTAPQHFKPG
ncbi:hypothetical protein K431DRAFT_100170 [Polychaeton citri CBS 116435]|uniref:Uncharacterized protein n=1 Tax=Polychaeton citri CBS 116435 TaxID=1314669 RepID=A0A9P4QDL3_9PEZI|nr:hypothetical protein K431DRAFT_100170 [Polychaeton citri CBS 116435]